MVLLFCFAVPYLLVAIPGKFVVVTLKPLLSNSATKHDVALHGWPAVHCIANHESVSTTTATALDNRKISDSVLFGAEGKLSGENIHSIIWANDRATIFLATDFVFWGPYVHPNHYQYPNFWTNTSGYMYFGPGCDDGRWGTTRRVELRKTTLRVVSNQNLLVNQRRGRRKLLGSYGKIKQYEYSIRGKYVCVSRPSGLPP